MPKRQVSIAVQVSIALRRHMENDSDENVSVTTFGVKPIRQFAAPTTKSWSLVVIRVVWAVVGRLRPGLDWNLRPALRSLSPTGKSGERVAVAEAKSQLLEPFPDVG